MGEILAFPGSLPAFQQLFPDDANTFHIVSEVLLDAWRLRFVLEAVEFEESLRPTKDSKFYGELVSSGGCVRRF